MSKLDWRKAGAPLGPVSFDAEISDRAASEDHEILDEQAKKRRKELNKLSSNWLKTNEEVRAYKEALKGKK